MKKSVLVLGDGLLGSELVSQTNWEYLSKKKDGFDASTFDAGDMGAIYLRHTTRDYTHIINCIAHTDTRDNEKYTHYTINVKFVNELVKYCNTFNKKLIHISTDYVYANSVPYATEESILSSTRNWYGQSKMLGDYMVQIFSKNYLLIRTTHKKKPYPYDYAWLDLIGNFDYVDIIAKMIIQLVDADASGIYNVGTEVKSLYELAKRTNSDVKIDPTSYDGRPYNTTMNLNKLYNFLKNNKKV